MKQLAQLPPDSPDIVKLGVDHYEVRKFPGWHHHMLTTMLAHFFLWHLKIKLGKKAAFITISQLRVLLTAILPLIRNTLKAVFRKIIWIQKRNLTAYMSHRKKIVQKLGLTDQVTL